MGNHKDAENGATSPSAASEVKPAFNPYTALTDAQLIALAGNFNKQWRAAHSLDIALAMTEFGCSENEAIFFASLKSDAEAIIDRNTVSDAVKYLTSMLTGVAFPKSQDVSLGLIEGRYNELKPELRKTVGIRVRDYAGSKWESATANGILDKVYAHLGIKEADWMR